MGVHGLWRLIEPSGQPVPLETLQNKVLAIDVSIWLHQAIKGFQDAKGGLVANAHLYSLFHRICKLLYFRIKPIFVFDGAVPALKKRTIELRQKHKQKNNSEAHQIQQKLMKTILKHSAIANVLSESTKSRISSEISPSKSSTNKNQNEIDDLFYLPPPPATKTSLKEDTSDESSEEQYYDSTSNGGTSSDDDHHCNHQFDLHSFDTESAAFKRLPIDVRHDILTDLKETRKQSSWGRIAQMPTQSDDFATYQMRRLLKRQTVQSTLEALEKEMDGKVLSLGQLEKLMQDHGVIPTDNEKGEGARIASDENKRFVLITDLKKALEEAKLKEQEKVHESELELQKPEHKVELQKPEHDVELQKPEHDVELQKPEHKVELRKPEHKVESRKLENNEVLQESKDNQENSGEFDEELKRAIALSLQDEPSTSKGVFAAEKITQLSFLDDEKLTSSSDEDAESRNKIGVFSSAQQYMREYGGLNTTQIEEIITNKTSKLPKKILETQKIDTIEENHDLKLNVEEKVVSLKGDFNLVENVPKELSSDSSDEDDFIEVPSKPKDVLQIVFQPVEKLENDLFSDIFNSEKHEISPDNLRSETEDETANSKTTVENVDNREKLSETVTNIVKENSADTNLNKKETLLLSLGKLKELKENLSKEKEVLESQKSTKERMAVNISDQIYQESQELLELFGIPYIIAPMEAEAQCAFLDSINLTDGTITDDSDIWLFGGTKVYKNFFNHSKQVLEYRAENIQQNFNLTRHQMILLALLVGSDYTIGLTGVGPVTALEILAAFPSSPPPKTPNDLLSGLSEFREWITTGSSPGPGGRTALRTKLKNLSKITSSFPSRKVAQAYLEPCVETSKEAFTWAKPNYERLAEFARTKLGWTRVRSDEVLGPVKKRLEEHSTQTSIRDFFTTIGGTRNKGKIETVMSKRVRKAVGKIGNPAEVSDDDDYAKSKKKMKRNNCDKIDEDLRVLKETKSKSKKRVKEIAKEVEEKMQEIPVKRQVKTILHKKEVIPQKERDKSDLLRNKMKAIEIFRKSKKGPGFVQRREKTVKVPKEDAALSESSSDE